MYFCTVNITNTTMKMDFPQVDLPTEVLAWTNVTEDILNIYKQSCRLQACIVAICTEGSMKASINLLDYEIRPDNIVTGNNHPISGENRKSMPLLCRFLRLLCRTNQSDEKHR